MVKVAIAECGGDHTHEVLELIVSEWHPSPGKAKDEVLEKLAALAYLNGPCRHGLCPDGQTCAPEFDVDQALTLIRTRGRMSLRTGRVSYRSRVEQGTEFEYSCQCGDDG